MAATGGASADAAGSSGGGGGGDGGVGGSGSSDGGLVAPPPTPPFTDRSFDVAEERIPMRDGTMIDGLIYYPTSGTYEGMLSHLWYIEGMTSHLW
jgi:hypothetical protein